MTKKTIGWAAAFLGAAALACDDAASPLATGEAEIPDPTLPAALATAEVPDEFARAPGIFQYWTDVGFSGSRAWAQGYMRFFANHAQQDLTLTAQKNGSTVARRTSHARDTWFLPRHTSQWVTSNIELFSSCGHTAGGSTQHAVWHQLAVQTKLTQWGRTGRSSGDDAIQPRCSTDCANQLLVETDECSDGSAGSPGSGGDSLEDETESLDCQTEHIVLLVDGRVVYSGPAQICE